jgi:hypothetical protein
MMFLYPVRQAMMNTDMGGTENKRNVRKFPSPLTSSSSRLYDLDNLEERGHWEDIDVGGRAILKWILEK